MANTKQPKTQEKFKTMIGGQALIEGIMMRGPDKDAVVVQGQEGLTVEVTPEACAGKVPYGGPSFGACTISLALTLWE